MKETLLKAYERKSTLWKNANAFYVAQDWTRMECLYTDFEEEREQIKSTGTRIINSVTDEDITDKFVKERYTNKYVIRLINKRRTNSKSFSYTDKNEANMCFKKIMNHKIMNGWSEVK